MRIGIDLDNTIIFYDEAFAKAAIARGLLPADFTGSKQQVRDAIRTLPEGETEWQHLQGYVYGAGLSHASLFADIDIFLHACRGKHELFIVSHKTEFGHFDPERVNLRDAARSWLAAQGFFDRHGFDKNHLFFAPTRADKVTIIRDLKLDWFIDDLAEVYEEPHFPPSTKQILFSNASTPPAGHWTICKDWKSIAQTVFADTTRTLP